jgi:hypothetical protein
MQESEELAHQSRGVHQRAMDAIAASERITGRQRATRSASPGPRRGGSPGARSTGGGGGYASRGCVGAGRVFMV